MPDLSLQGAIAIGIVGSLLPLSLLADDPGRISLAEASAFNAVIFGDFEAPSSDVEGRLAVEGDLRINSYSIADKLNAGEAGISLLVGGDMHFPSGRIYYGHTLVKGSADNVGAPVRNGLTDNQLLLDQVDLPLDFDRLEQKLIQESLRLSRVAPNGEVKSQWGGLYLTGDCESPVQIFALDGQTLLKAHTFQLSCIPANSHLVFNISGTRAGLTNMSMESARPYRTRTLYNFFEATELVLSGIGVQGSLLAPLAEITHPQGVIHGTLIAKKWHGTMQLNHVTFDGLNVNLLDCDLTTP